MVSFTDFPKYNAPITYTLNDLLDFSKYIQDFPPISIRIRLNVSYHSCMMNMLVYNLPFPILLPFLNSL